MDILSIAILIFIIMESANVAILYFQPGSRLGNGVGVFNAFHNSESEEQRLFASYLINWVAGGETDLYSAAGRDSGRGHRACAGGSDRGYDSLHRHLVLAAASHHPAAGQPRLHYPQRLLQSSGLDDRRVYAAVYGGAGAAYTNQGDLNMEKRHSIRHKKLWIFLAAVLLVCAGLAGAFAWYVSDYYRAEDTALEVLAQNNNITVQDNLTVLSPSYPTDTALIFYPGAKVEAKAYLPLLDQIRQTGVTCILVHMPFNMAIFDWDAPEDILPRFPEIRHWYMAGHSMGGAMASQFASEHPEQLDGLILLGAYIYGDYPDDDALTVYGSLNQSVEDHIDYTENIVEIQGGNHAQFGNYGPQKGDLPATISAQEQQEQTVAAIEDFISRQNQKAA